MTSGNLLATGFSATALLFSGYSLYESVLKSPQLAIFVPPRIDYTDPDRPESPFEVFVIPLTIANDGARSSTVNAINLEVTNPRTKQTKRFYAARLGTWGDKPAKPFAPVALAGKASQSQAVQFFPRNEETIPRILDLDAGSYTLKVTLDAAAPRSFWSTEAAPVSLTFERQIGKLDYRFFQGTGTMEMWAGDYKAASSRE
jgi:hypothetical protein